MDTKGKARKGNTKRRREVYDHKGIRKGSTRILAPGYLEPLALKGMGRKGRDRERDETAREKIEEERKETENKRRSRWEGGEQEGEGKGLMKKASGPLG